MGIISNCEVCEIKTDNYSASPFLPYTGAKCLKCFKAHLIPLRELMSTLVGVGTASSYKKRKEQWIKWWGKDDEYAEKFWIPTAKFFGMTVEEAWEKAIFIKMVKDIDEKRRNNGLGY